MIYKIRAMFNHLEMNNVLKRVHYSMLFSLGDEYRLVFYDVID